MAAQDADGGVVGLLHDGKRPFDPAALGAAPHVGGKKHTGAQGLGQDQNIAGTQAALAQDVFRVGDTIQGKAQGRFSPFAGVAADEAGPGRAEHAQGTGHQLGQLMLGFFRQAMGQGHQHQGRMGVGAHGIEVVEGMVGGNASEHIGVIDKGPEAIDGVDQNLAGRDFQDGGIVGLVQPDDDAGFFVTVDRLQNPLEDIRADLGAAAAAAHVVAQVAEGRRIGQSRRNVRRPVRRGHLWQGVELVHETAVDPVFPAPYPGALQRPAAFRGDGICIAGADQAEELPLRAERFERLAEQGTAQVFAQRRSLADGEDAGLGPRMAVDGGNITAGENSRVGDRLQGVGDPDKAFLVGGQSGFGGPGLGAGFRRPQDVVGFDFQTRSAGKFICFDPNHPFPGMHGDAPFGQDPLECRLHPFVMARQHAIGGGYKVELQSRRITTLVLQFPRQLVADRKQKLDATGATADNGDGNGAGGLPHAGANGGPALQKAVDGFDGQGMVADTGNALVGRRRADVNGQQVIGDRRSAFADHLLVVPVEADGLVVQKPGPGKPGQRAEVDVGIVECVMTGQQTRQHAGIGRLHVFADQRQANTGYGLHGEGFEHRDVAVAASDEDEVFDSREIRRLQGIGPLTSYWWIGAPGAGPARLGASDARYRRP